MPIVRVVLVSASSTSATHPPSQQTTACGAVQVAQLRRRDRESSLCTHVTDFDPSSPPGPKTPLAVFAIIILVCLVAGVIYVAVYKQGYSPLAGHFWTIRARADGTRRSAVEVIQPRRGRSGPEAGSGTASRTEGGTAFSSPWPRLPSFPPPALHPFHRSSRAFAGDPLTDGSALSLLRAHDNGEGGYRSNGHRSSVDGRSLSDNGSSIYGPLPIGQV